MSTAATLNGMPKSNSGKTPQPNRKADAQLNIRFERQFLDQFDRALASLVPRVAEKAFMEMVIESFVLDPEGFVGVVRQFLAEKKADNN